MWPDEQLTEKMLADACRLAKISPLLGRDVECHVLALLTRVRELERNLDQLDRKVRHGCTDANCPECDGQGEPTCTT